MNQQRAKAMALTMISGCLLAACAGNDKPSITKTPSMAASVPSDIFSGTKSLPPQSLDDGECALILWTRRTPHQFVFFMKAGSGNAKLSDDGAERILTLSKAEGGLFGQFSESMRFQGEAGGVWSTSLEPGERIDGGQRIESGQLTHDAVDGWQTIIPIIGVRACKGDV